jgi:uncharacterized phage-associated protein
MSASVRAAANRLLDLAAREGKTIDPLQLQKLLYFAEGWSLAITGESLFDDPIEAWAHGPVVPDIYYACRQFGARPITIRLHDWDAERHRPMIAEGNYSSDQAMLIEVVWESYGQMSGPRLIEATHDFNSPWRRARMRNERNARISRDDMREWFLREAQEADAEAERTAKEEAHSDPF